MSFHSVAIQKLLSTNAHIGRRVTAHHFKIFSEGTRNSLNIIDADKTLICLRNACNFIGHLARNDARFLFVNTNSLFDEIIAQMSRTIGIKNDTTWRLGGFLTNSWSPKKFRGRNKKFSLGSVRPPDCIVIFDTEMKSSVIQEAYKMQIPIVGLVDSSMPWDTFKRITYPVPANDTVEFVYLFCNLITKTILKEKKDAAGADSDNKLIARGDVEKDAAAKRVSEKSVLCYENLPAIPEETRQLLNKLVVLKINGSPGNVISSNIPKCALNAKYGCNIPLIAINAVDVHDDVLK
ncbi:hypothetical protein M569_11203, partial [Genlisea aurea]